MVNWILSRLKEKGTVTVVVGLLASVGSLFGLDLDAEAQLKLQSAIAGITGFLVVIFKEKTVE